MRNETNSKTEKDSNSAASHCSPLIANQRALVEQMLRHFESYHTSQSPSKFKGELREAIYQLISALPKQHRPENLPIEFQCA